MPNKPVAFHEDGRPEYMTTCQECRTYYVDFIPHEFIACPDHKQFDEDFEARTGIRIR